MACLGARLAASSAGVATTEATSAKRMEKAARFIAALSGLIEGVFGCA